MSNKRNQSFVDKGLDFHIAKNFSTDFPTHQYRLTQSSLGLPNVTNRVNISPASTFFHCSEDPWGLILQEG